MNETQEAAARLFGIDVSRWQNTIDWNTVKQAGVKFAFIKATEHGSFVDPKFIENRKACRELGIPCGFYHFFRPKISAEEQIDNFVRTVGQLNPGELPPVLDVEVPEDWTAFSVDERVKMVITWCEAVEAQLGMPPLLYMSSNFAAGTLGASPKLARYKLWVANYTTAPEPKLPAPWTSWTFWQYSSKGRIAGIETDVDLDVFYSGNAADLDALRVKSNKAAGPADQDFQWGSLLLALALAALAFYITRLLTG